MFDERGKVRRMGADIYDWDRVHGKGSYAAMADAQDKPEQPRTDSKADDPAKWWLNMRHRWATDQWGNVVCTRCDLSAKSKHEGEQSPCAGVS